MGVTAFVVCRANRFCVPVYYGWYCLRSMLCTGMAPELRGIRFWCLAHAALDLFFFHVTTNPPMIYFPIHIATHMALVLDLAKIAKRRIASRSAMTTVFDLCVFL